MTKIVEVKDSAVVGLESNGSIRIHLTDEGENMENAETCGCDEGVGMAGMVGMVGMDVMAGGCCRRPPMPVSDVSELYKSLKSGIQSARERISRKPDWNIRKKEEAKK